MNLAIVRKKKKKSKGKNKHIKIIQDLGKNHTR